jgi:hypothetical protein
MVVKKKLVKQIKKVKKPTRGKLIKKLDHIFSQYIRLSNANKKWLVVCYTCNDVYHWKQIQNGHFITRWNYKYRRDIDNCKPQCVRCNIFYSWNYKPYTIKMIAEYGEEKVKFMIWDKALIKIHIREIEDLIEHYTKKVSKLLVWIKDNH